MAMAASLGTTMTKRAVLITIDETGSMDYVKSDDSIAVVVIDWSDLTSENVSEFMPVDIQDRIKEVRALPESIPWRTDVLKRLEKFHSEVEQNAYL